MLYNSIHFNNKIQTTVFEKFPSPCDSLSFFLYSVGTWTGHQSGHQFILPPSGLARGRLGRLSVLRGHIRFFVTLPYSFSTYFISEDSPFTALPFLLTIRLSLPQSTSCLSFFPNSCTPRAGSLSTAQHLRFFPFLHRPLAAHFAHRQ